MLKNSEYANIQKDIKRYYRIYMVHSRINLKGEELC